MKGFVLFVLIFITFYFSIFAESNNDISIGLGAEFNMNSRENFAGGAVLCFNYNLKPSFAVGINATASSNFAGIYVIEPAALFKWYILSKDFSGLFIQADAGVYNDE